MYASILTVLALFLRSYLDNLIGSITWIFAINPYAVGDVIWMNDMNYTVSKISLFSSLNSFIFSII